MNTTNTNNDGFEETFHFGGPVNSERQKNARREAYISADIYRELGYNVKVVRQTSVVTIPFKGITEWRNYVVKLA